MISTLTAVHGGWTSWSAWSWCTESCGGGTRTRSRNCTNPSPAYGGQTCAGLNLTTEVCNTQKCPGSYFVVYCWTNERNVGMTDINTDAKLLPYLNRAHLRVLQTEGGRKCPHPHPPCNIGNIIGFQKHKIPRNSNKECMGIYIGSRLGGHCVPILRRIPIHLC